MPDAASNEDTMSHTRTAWIRADYWATVLWPEYDGSSSIKVIMTSPKDFHLTPEYVDEVAHDLQRRLESLTENEKRYIRAECPYEHNLTFNALEPAFMGIDRRTRTRMWNVILKVGSITCATDQSNYLTLAEVEAETKISEAADDPCLQALTVATSLEVLEHHHRWVDPFVPDFYEGLSQLTYCVMSQAVESVTQARRKASPDSVVKLVLVVHEGNTDVTPSVEVSASIDGSIHDDHRMPMIPIEDFTLEAVLARHADASDEEED